jgi:hypothetical protein
MSTRPPHIVYADAEALLKELCQLFWAIGVHAEVAERFAALGDIDGLDHILGCLAEELRRASALRQDIPDARS